jgi:putrescine transport system substrate-binding protein
MRYLFLFLAVLLNIFLSADAKEDNILYLYSWTGNIDQQLIKQFEQETGIKVIFDVYDSNEILEAKLLTGKTAYDVVFPSVTPNYIRQIKLGIYQPLDKKKLKNYNQLDPKIMKLIAQFDKDNTFGLPYALGTTGFGYVEKQIHKYLPEGLPNSLRAVFDKRYIQKLSKCGVIFLDQAQDVFEAAQAYSGYKQPSCLKDDQLDASVNVVRGVRDFIQSFTSNVDMAITQLANGEVCLVHSWSNDIFLAQREADRSGTGVKIKYMIPKEWPGLWIDMMAIPKSAPHPDNAHKFIDFMLRPDNAAKIINYTYMYAPNLGARQYVPQEIQDNPAIFIPPEVLDNLRLQESLPIRQERKVMRKWTHLKLGW